MIVKFLFIYLEMVKHSVVDEEISVLEKQMEIFTYPFFVIIIVYIYNFISSIVKVSRYIKVP
jgi:putative effector of murein hydrolase LrgA (UPF0299 family)